MPEAVTAGHLRTLIALHRTYLRRAEADVEIEALGPIAGELFNNDRWRRSWPARARRLLAAALDAHVAALGEKPRARQVRDALGAWWGVTEFPIETYELLSDRMDVSTKQLSRWHADAVADAAAHDAIARLARIAPPQRGLRRTLLWAPPAGDWPPEDFQLSLLRALDRNHDIDSAKHDDAIRLLRAAVADWLAEYLKKDEHAQLYRQLARTIVRPWRRGDRLWLAPDPADADDGEYTRSLAAVAHLAFYELVLDDRHAERIQLLLGERYGVDLMIDKIVARNVEDMRFITVSGAMGREVTRVVVGERLDIAPAFVQHVDPRMLDHERAPGRFTGAAAFAAAKTMREAAIADRPALARQYVADRIGYQPPGAAADPRLDLARESGLSRRSSRGESDHALLALADQAVHLMVLDLFDIDLLADLSHAIQRSPSPSEYQPLDMRNRGLLQAKLKQFGHGLTLMLQARSELRDLAGEGSPYDRKAILESGQQIALSAGGVCVNVIEDLLASPDDTIDEGTIDYARAALAWSAGAMLGLKAIAASRPAVAEGAAPGLNIARYGDFHISWVNWEVKARQQQLRAQVVVRALITAGLLTESAVGSGVYDCSLETIEKNYRALITLPWVGADDVLGIAIQGIWIAMLRGGAVPVEKAVAPALKDIGPIDLAPDTIAKRGVLFRVIDAGETVSWLRDKGYKPGVLGYLPPAGPMARALRTSSDGLFAGFQESLGAPMIPDRPGTRAARRD